MEQYKNVQDLILKAVLLEGVTVQLFHANLHPKLPSSVYTDFPEIFVRFSKRGCFSEVRIDLMHDCPKEYIERQIMRALHDLNEEIYRNTDLWT